MVHHDPALFSAIINPHWPHEAATNSPAVARIDIHVLGPQAGWTMVAAMSRWSAAARERGNAHRQRRHCRCRSKFFDSSPAIAGFGLDLGGRLEAPGVTRYSPPKAITSGSLFHALVRAIQAGFMSWSRHGPSPLHDWPPVFVWCSHWRPSGRRPPLTLGDEIIAISYYLIV